MTLPRPAPAAWTTSRFGNAGVGDPGATEAKNLPFGHLFEVNHSVGGDLDRVKLTAPHAQVPQRSRHCERHNDSWNPVRGWTALRVAGLASPGPADYEVDKESVSAADPR